ncbi:hypothetical protein M8J76_006171 [Diaphorina citri]|nr:hypothetical protein M8J76_006171 [Diaphorina citri]KAI5746987.1 hypothetical protein M8J77_009875 [Diaphorina citri]
MGQSVLRTFFNLVLIVVLPLSAKHEGPHVNWTEYTDSPGNVSHFDYGQFTRVDICGGDKAHCLKTIKSEVRKASRKNHQGDEIRANCEKEDSITDNMFTEVCWLRQKFYDEDHATKITLYEAQFYVRRSDGAMYGRDSYPYGTYNWPGK